MELIAKPTGNYSLHVILPKEYFKEGDIVYVETPEKAQSNAKDKTTNKTNGITKQLTDLQQRLLQLEKEIRELRNAKPTASRVDGLSEADLKQIDLRIESKMADRQGF